MNNLSKNSKKNQIGNRKAGSRNNQMIPHPPPIQSYQIDHSTRLRFVTNAALVEQAITYQNLLDCILIATSGTVVYDMFYACRIRFVEAWSLPALGSANSVSILFNSNAVGFVGNQVFHTDTSMGLEPAHVKCRPGRGTLANLFQTSSAAVAFTLNLPVGTVIDVKLDFKGFTLANSVAAQNVGAALTTGTTYFRGLDGVAAAASKFVPPSGLAVA